MKHRRYLTIALCLIIVLSLALSACNGNSTTAATTKAPGTSSATTAGTSAGTTAPAGAGKVIYSNGGPSDFFETPWLNPGTFTYNKTLYAHLIVADENLNPIPNDPDALATYQYSTDGKTLVFNLRDNAYWHDGNKITPDDIKWSIEYAAKTAVLNSVFAATFKAIAGSDGGKAASFSGIKIDGNKITITFDAIAPRRASDFHPVRPPAEEVPR